MSTLQSTQLKIYISYLLYTYCCTFFNTYEGKCYSWWWWLNKCILITAMQFSNITSTDYKLLITWAKEWTVKPWIMLELELPMNKQQANERGSICIEWIETLDLKYPFSFELIHATLIMTDRFPEQYCISGSYDMISWLIEVDWQVIKFYCVSVHH